MSAFPTFQDGDVKIIITGARQYQLHSSILKASSPAMERLLDDQYTARLSSRAIKKGAVVRNRLVSVENIEPELRIYLVLEPVYLDSDGSPIDSKPIGLDLENGIVVPPIYTAYDAVLGAFYHRPVDFGEFGETNLDEILETAGQIIEVSEYLEVIDMITKPIEAALLSTGQTVQRAIAKDPAEWLDFAYRIRSKPIFREALIHAVGQYNTLAVQTAMRGPMRQEILEIVQEKAKTLIVGIKTAIRNILTYYPLHLQRARTLGLAEVDNYGRSSYSNDIFTWMALTVFRHWVTQGVANDKTHHSEDLGFEVISAISKGGDHYLDRPALAEFHKLFPMSNKGMAVVENKITDIKEEIKKFVELFVKNNAQLHTLDYGHRYFTCTNVEWFDYPWIAHSDATKKRDHSAETDEEEGDESEAIQGDMDADERREVECQSVGAEVE